MKSLAIYFSFFLIIVFSTRVFSQEIVFSQDYTYKNNISSKKLMGAFVVEDTITDEKLIILSGSKTVNFYYVDNNWKLLKTFEQSFIKNSAFTTDNFNVVSYNHKAMTWNLIVENVATYTAEKIDMEAGKYAVAGTVFEDKKPNWLSYSFTDGNRSYNLYLNNSNGFSLACIDEQLGIKTYPVDLSSQLPVKKERKLNPADDIFGKLEEIDTLTSQSVIFTQKKVKLYIQPKTFVFVVASDEEPYAEMMEFDKQTGKRLRSELFSTSELLDLKSEKVNTNALLYDGKLWMITAHKKGGVLAAFDAESKKLIKSITYNDETAPKNTVYGPVMYKMLPEKVNAREEFKGVKDKLEDINMATFCKDMYKERPCIYITPINEKEYVVNIASYALVYTMAPQTGVGEQIRGTTYNYNPGIYESSALGFSINKSDFQFKDAKYTYNDINRTNAGNRYSKIKPNYETNNNNPEYKNRKAYVIKEQTASFKIYTIYYFEKKFKVSAKSTPIDLSKINSLK